MNNELAWAAGFWDGEGCCSISAPKRSKTKTIILDLSQSFSPECLIRFQNAVGGLGNLCGPYVRSGNPNQFWTWRASSGADVQKVMELLTPYLSTPKLQQYERSAKERAESIAHLPTINKPSEEELERMYWVEDMTLKQIGDRFEVTGSCIWKWLRSYGIPSRPKVRKVVT